MTTVISQTANVEVALQAAAARDAAVIAALHTSSRCGTYRGIFSDVYLDHEILTERQRYWRRQLQAEPRAQQSVLMATDGSTGVGFICVVLDAEP